MGAERALQIRDHEWEEDSSRWRLDPQRLRRTPRRRPMRRPRRKNRPMSKRRMTIMKGVNKYHVVRDDSTGGCLTAAMFDTAKLVCFRCRSRFSFDTSHFLSGVVWLDNYNLLHLVPSFAPAFSFFLFFFFPGCLLCLHSGPLPSTPCFLEINSSHQ